MYGSRFLCVVALVLMFSAAGAEEKLQPRRVEDAAGAIIGMTLRGNVLYTAGRGRLDWFDVSDPEKPVKLGSIPGVYGRQMLTAGDRLYITGRQQGLRIFDIKNPRRPTLIRRFDTVEMVHSYALPRPQPFSLSLSADVVLYVP